MHGSRDSLLLLCVTEGSGFSNSNSAFTHTEREKKASHEAVALWVCCVEQVINAAATGQLLSDITAVLHMRKLVICYIFIAILVLR